jgi:PIN domain
VFVIADTSVYIEHEDKLEDLDLAPMLKIWEDPVHVILPIVIVDELDGLKRSKTNYERWRAGYTLAVLDRVFASSTGPAQLRAEDFPPLARAASPAVKSPSSWSSTRPVTFACLSMTTRSSTGPW